MFDLMQKDEDPRFKESKFLSFLSKLKNGDVKIVGDKLVELKQEGDLSFYITLLVLSSFYIYIYILIYIYIYLNPIINNCAFHIVFEILNLRFIVESKDKSGEQIYEKKL